MENSKKTFGLGDLVAKITYVTGIDKMVKGITKMMGKEDCGCKKRQEKLNQYVIFGSELEEEDI